MKFYTIIRICLVVLFGLLFTKTKGQLVTTVAGQFEQAGALNGNANVATFNNPHGIAVHPDGTVFVADRWNHLIRKISTDGMVSTFAGTEGFAGDSDGAGANARFHEPWAVCVDSNGDLLVADTKNNKIRKINEAGLVTTIAGTGNFGANDGNTDNATFGNPSGIVADENGNIFVADHKTHIIRKISPDSRVTTIAGTPFLAGDADGPGNAALFNRPYGLTLDNDGNLVVADEWNHKIRQISPDGNVVTIAGTGFAGNQNGAAAEASFNFPWDVAVDPLGNILVADGSNFQIRKITVADEVVSMAGTAGVTGGEDGFGEAARFAGITSIAYSPYSMEFYFTDAYNHLVRKLTDFEIGNTLRPESFIAAQNNDTLSFCFYEPVVFKAVPSGFHHYSFFLNNELVQNGASPEVVLENLPPGNYTIDVVSSRAGQSQTAAPVHFIVLPPTIATVNTVGETTMYVGDSVTLVTGTSPEYFWSTGDTTATITVFESGSYSVETMDINGCLALSDTVLVTTIELPPVPEILDREGTAITDTAIAICKEESVFLFTKYTTGIQWILNGWPLEKDTLNFIRATEGEYKLSITTDGITQTSAPLIIRAKPFPDFDFRASPRAVLPGTPVDFELVSDANLECTWRFGDSLSLANTAIGKQVTFTYKTLGLYTVQLEAIAADNCKATLKKPDFITVTNFPERVFVPSAFSPNDDGINDLLFIHGNPSTIDFRICNQWGQVVFQTNDISVAWDGKLGGKPVQAGNFNYFLEYQHFSTAKKYKSGQIMLLR